MTLELLQQHRCFGGTQCVYAHQSEATGTRMEFSIYLPPQARDEKRPLLTYLSGLTCTWANVTEKGCFQQHAAEHGLVVLCPDTSPRGTDLPGEHDADDFGSGAGFYLDATQEPWARHYRMFTYIAHELPALIAAHFAVDLGRQGIFGHSMGGHGALTIAFKTKAYLSVSAFAPIVAPCLVPWGKKAFNGYLGANPAAWQDHDACHLVRQFAGRNGWTTPILIDQGTADGFLAEQLKPELFENACRDSAVPLILRRQQGYDHSYYFIRTFMAAHIEHHARLLKDQEQA
jgi:S-formylglutathione hydrolase